MTLGYLKIKSDEVFITRRFLTDNFVSHASLRFRMDSVIKKGGSKYVHIIDEKTGEMWINYSTIPDNDLREYGLPQNKQRLVELLCDAVEKTPGKFHNHLIFFFCLIWECPGNWKPFIPYYTPFYLDIDQCRKLAKTHAIIKEILIYKKEKYYPLKEIYHAYMRIPHVTYKAGNLNYFYRKIREFEKGTIHEILMHKFKVKGRAPYKITSSIEAIIKRHYISNKRYSISMIHKLTNLELVALNKPKISRTAVSKVCHSPNFKNRADFIRYGRKYSEDFLLPYLKRKKVEKAGALYEVDGKDLRIKCFRDNQIRNLFITVVFDVYSGKIVGYHLDTQEDTDSVMSALKMAFEKNHIIPEFIIYDNHVVVTKSDMFGKLKDKLLDYGCVLDTCRPNNPKGKGSVENWFRLFNTNYLILMKGFLGSGMTAKSRGARANNDLRRVYLSKVELKTFWAAEQEVAKKVKKYNSELNEKTGISPDSKYRISMKSIKKRFRRHDITYLFGKVKEVTVRRGLIHFEDDKKKYTYKINQRDKVNKYNRQKLKIYFFSHYPYRISAFNMKNVYIGSFDLHPEVNQVPRTEKDIKAMQYIYLKNVQDVKNNVMELLEEIKVGETQLKVEAPIDILDNEIYKELEDLKTEDYNLILKEFAVSKPYGRKIIKAIEENNNESFEFEIDEKRKYKSI